MCRQIKLKLEYPHKDADLICTTCGQGISYVDCFKGKVGYLCKLCGYMYLRGFIARLEDELGIGKQE